MKLYVIVRGEYCGMTDQAFIHGVFSTEEQAKRALEFPETDWFTPKDCEIREMELDTLYRDEDNSRIV